jgi:2'-5' RNA ligase
MVEQSRVHENEQNGERWRVFAAVPVNDGVRAVMQRAQNRLAPLRWPVRWVDPRLAHITLRFYGDSDLDSVDEIRGALSDIVARHDSMQLQTGGIGAFPSAARLHVLWLGLEGDVKRLRLLAAAINPDGPEAGKPGRSFRPHITLARLRNGATPPVSVDEAAAALELPAVSLTLDRVQLIRSVLGPKGPSYTVIDEWMLAQPDIVPTQTPAGLHEHT